MTDKAETALAYTPFFLGGQEVRTVKVDGQAHLVGNDVARRLGYVNPGNAMRDHCKGGPIWAPLQTAGSIQKPAS